MLFMPWINEE